MEVCGKRRVYLSIFNFKKSQETRNETLVPGSWILILILIGEVTVTVTVTVTKYIVTSY